MLLTADVAAGITGISAVDWPPPSNVPPLLDEVPVMRFDANHVIVDKTVCRVPGPNDICTFQVSWSSNDANATIDRIDLNNGGTTRIPFASGLSNVKPDDLAVGARVQYEITYRYNGTGVLTRLRTPEVRVLRQGVIADANVEDIACKPSANNGCDLPNHDASTGAVAGEASTDGGAAQYAIPIAVPPGRNGVEPKLSLNYNSRSGNGVAGQGWSLSGLSAIHRCPRTMAQDGAGKAAAVSLSNNDALCLDGQRLIPMDASGNINAVNLVYGANGTHYRTEINSFSRVTQYGGDLASDASCFKVEHKSGEISYYGGVSDGGLCSGGGSRQVFDGLSVPLSWNIERELDAVGNSIAYAYNTPAQYGKGEKLITSILYTGTKTADGDRRINFHYENRPDADRSRSYSVGGMSEGTQRLKRIVASVAGSAANSYTLNYTDPISGASGNLHSGHSALQSIKQCASGGEETQGPGANGSEVCLPETIVAWNDLPPDYVLRPLTIAGLPDVAPDSSGKFVDRTTRTIGDLDGDGVREVLVHQRQSDNVMHTWLIKLNADRVVTSTLDITAIGTLSSLSQNLQTDYDGDGRADLMATASGELRLYRWNLTRGANFAGTTAATFTTVAVSGAVTGQLVSNDDFDGDGQPDLLLDRRSSNCSDPEVERLPPGTTSVGHVLCYYRNTTAAAGAAVSFDTGELAYSWTQTLEDGGLSPVGDLNGDGTADLVVTAKTLQAGGAVNAITTVLLSAMPGLGPIEDCEPSVPPTANRPTRWYRCAADALDLPTSNTGYRSTGAAMRWYDVNGDGLVDLLYALPGTCDLAGHSCTRGSWNVQIANGRGFNAAVQIGGNTDALLMTSGMEKNQLRYAALLPSADLDSDGKIDLLYPVALAARQCSAVMLNYKANAGDLCDYEWKPGAGGRGLEACSTRVWMCGNDPAADIAGSSSYSLPALADMPPMPGGVSVPAITTDNLYSLRTHQASFPGNPPDQSLYYMAGLRFVATATGYEAQSFSLDASAGTNRAAHRVAMTLNDTISANNAEDLYGDGLTDLMTRVGCANAGNFHQLCRFVGNGSTGPATVSTGPAPNAAPVAVNVTDFNNGLRSLLNENVGTAESVNAAPTLPGLVRAITNGLGDRTLWTYAPLASKAGRIPGKLPLHVIPETGYVDSSHFYFQSTMPVVSTMASSTGIGGLLGFRSWRYGYSEAMYNRLGRGFQGFRAIVREQVTLSGDQSRALREVTLFHQKFPLTGKIAQTRSGAPLLTIAAQPVIDWVHPFTETVYTWRCRLNRSNCVTDGAPTVGSFDYPFLDQQTNTSYDPSRAENGDLRKVAELVVSNFNPDLTSPSSAWDAFGNLTHSVTVARDLAEASGSIPFVSSKRTQHSASYLNTTSPTWWPGKLTATEDSITPVTYGASHPLPADVTLTAQMLKTDYTWNDDRTPNTVIVESNDASLCTEKVFTYPSGSDNHGLPETVSDSYFDSVIGHRVSRTTRTLYSSDGYFPSRVFDAAGAETTFAIRARDGQVVETTLPTQVRVRSAFDAFGRSIRTRTSTVSNGIETPEGQIVHIAWNPCTNGICPDAGIGDGGVRIGNSASRAEAFAAYRITTVQNGSPTQVVWRDLLGRDIKRAARGFDGTFVASLSEYDNMGALARQSVPFFLSSASSAAPFASSFSYDRAGRMTSKTGPKGEILLGQSAPASGMTTTAYTYEGNRTAVKWCDNVESCEGSPLRLDMVRYSGVLGLMRTEDALGGVTRYWSDAASRPVAIADARVNAQYPCGPSGPCTIPGGKVTRATYNKLGQRTNATDPNQGSWNFVYNGASELVQQTDARNITTTIRRDNTGRPQTQTSSLPAWGLQPAEYYRDEWTYRPADGLIEEVKRCTAGTAPTACTSGISGNTQWRESYVYAYGRVLSTTAVQRVGSNERSYSTLFHYDGNFSREKAVEYASGLRVQRIFTKHGALRDVLDADTGERFWGIGGQDALGNVTRQDYGNGVYGEYRHDALSGRVVHQQWSRLANGVPQIIDSIDYGYDPFANISAQRRIVPGLVDATESYSYDKLQRLTGSAVTVPGVAGTSNSVGYDYDVLGNITRKSDYSRNVTDAYQYASANGCGPNVATTILLPIVIGNSADRVISTCDANGNITQMQPASDSSAQGNPRAIRYDATNRPRHITQLSAPGSPSAQFIYAPDGRRVYEILGERYYPTPGSVGVDRLRYVMQGQRGYQVELTSDANGMDNATHRHELGDVSVVMKATPGNTGLTRNVYYKINDRVGSPLGILDNNGLFRQRNDDGSTNFTDTRLSFGAFGSGRNRDFSPRNATSEMPGRVNLSPATRLGFTGHEHLDSLGLIHMNGRVYDHRLGRFLSVDPLIQFPANSQSLNPYSYILNNPLSGTDPSGYAARTGSVCDRGEGACRMLDYGDNGSSDNSKFNGAWGLESRSWNTGQEPDQIGAASEPDRGQSLEPMVITPEGSAWDRQAQIVAAFNERRQQQAALDRAYADLVYRSSGEQLLGTIFSSGKVGACAAVFLACLPDMAANGAAAAEQGDMLGVAEAIFSARNPMGRAMGSARSNVENSVALGGAGGKWRAVDEVADGSVVQQATPTSCGQACAQMLLTDRGVIVDQLKLGGEMTSAQGLAAKMNKLDSGWVGAGVDSSSFGALNKTGSWSAMMWERGNTYGHWVVVDGLNDSGMVLLRDPFNATRYSMTPRDFDNAWNGYSVFKPKP